MREHLCSHMATVTNVGSTQSVLFIVYEKTTSHAGAFMLTYGDCHEREKYARRTSHRFIQYI